MVTGPKPKKFRQITDDDLKFASELADKGELDDAWDIVNLRLIESPNDPRALTIATQVNDKAKRLPVAYRFAKAAVQEAPKVSAVWMNLGRVCEQLYLEDEAHRAYKTALKLHPETMQVQKSLLLTNYSALLLQTNQWQEAESVCRQALQIDPGRVKASGNLGLALLAQGKWEEGWEAYAKVRNTDQARGYSYDGAPEWDGTPGQTVVVHGEQGIGDEICFASMIPDAVNSCRKVIIDCEPKLAGLFQRSFPKAKVYGTRWKRELDWAEEDRKFDATLSVGALGKFFRRKDEDFPCVPYLKPDPERLQMWRSLFHAKCKPVIGIAWSGGVQWTGEKFRRLQLEMLQPLFSGVKAHFVSLQYKDASEEIRSTPVYQYPYGTLTNDYDDTAAMVAAMDLVLTVPTSVAHLAGALGVPTIAMKASHSCWKFDSGLRFHPCTIIEHDKTWERTIDTAVAAIKRTLDAPSIHRLRPETAVSL